VYKLYLRLMILQCRSLARVFTLTPNSVKFISRSVQYSTLVRDISSYFHKDTGEVLLSLNVERDFFGIWQEISVNLTNE
jgi:hypothetical protein